MPIRLARPDDAGPIVEILRTSIEESAITFYDRVPSVDEVRTRIETAVQTHPWLVLERAEGVIGHAAASRYRSSEGTRWGVETSIGMAVPARGRGLGVRLYGALLDTAALLGFANAYAGITLPNAASVALHERLGFQVVGTFRRTGYKLGRWHDSLWMQKPLTRVDEPPRELRPPAALSADPVLAAAFAKATAGA